MAERNFRTAIDLQVAMTNMGTCSRQSGHDGKAESYFRRALGTNPRFGSAMAALADLDYSRGRYRSARAHLDTTSRLPSQPRGYSCWRSGSNVS